MQIEVKAKRQYLLSGISVPNGQLNSSHIKDENRKSVYTQWADTKSNAIRHNKNRWKKKCWRNRTRSTAPPSSTSATLSGRWAGPWAMWLWELTPRVPDVIPAINTAGFSRGFPWKALIVSEDREGATDPSPTLWHSTKHCLTGTNDQRSCRNNFLLMWSKFSTREHYTQSQTVHPHPDPHKSMFAEGMRKILRFTARVMGNFPEQVGCWAPPSCFPPPSARAGSKKVQ